MHLQLFTIKNSNKHSTQQGSSTITAKKDFLSKNPEKIMTKKQRAAVFVTI